MKLSLLTSLILAGIAQGDTIFDGKSLEQWSGNKDIWKIENGAITGEIKAGDRLRQNEFLFYKKPVGDFTLTLDYKITGGPTANSGIQIRSKNVKGKAHGYQCDLDAGKEWLGRIYDEHGRRLILERGTLTAIAKDGKRTIIPFEKDPKSFQQFVKKDDWNEYKIVARGHRIAIYINGVHFSTLQDYQDGQFDLSGLIALQLHSGVGPAKLQFKNIDLVEHKANSTPKEEGSKEVGVAPKDAPNIGFEKGDLSGWTATGDMAKSHPTKSGVLPRRVRATGSNSDGAFWYGGFEQGAGDKPKGTLTSEPFTVTHKFGGLLVGGGNHKQTRVEVVSASDNKVIQSFSGTNLEPMTRRSVDLTAYQGKKIFIRIVDEHSGGWGHINYDDFRFYNKAPSSSEGRLASTPLLWHLGENPNKSDKIPSVRKMNVPAGFEIKTIASEPDMVQPISFDFDSKGRIWVVESVDYPRKPKNGQGRDRILIFEDKDADGTYETKKVFKDNLSLVSGLAVGYGGVYVASAPDIYFIPDKNRDDKPDGEHQVLITGFSTRDTHETPNSFMWGNDGWIYGCHGMYNPCWVGKPGATKEEKTYIESAVWRLHPVTHEFQIYANGGSNQWGLAYNEHGDMFMNHCRSAWGLGPTTQVFRDGHYWAQQNKNHASFVAAPPKGYREYEIGENMFFKSIAAYGHGEGGAGFPGSKTIFGGHSHCGSMIYLGDNWPEEYRGQLYTNNLHGSQINREMLVKKDSAWLSYSHGEDVLYSDDPEYLGVHIKYGPDGAVYISDWADKQQCHNNHYEIWNRSNGRIYRMAWKATDKHVKVDLPSESNKKLISYIDHKNEWFPYNAQHVLRQRKAAGKDVSDVVADLKKIVFDIAHQNRFRALVMLDAVGGLDKETALKLIKDENEHLVKQTIYFIFNNQNITDSETGNALVKLAKTTKYPTLRLHLALLCQKRISDEFAKPILDSLAMNSADSEDRFIGKAVWYAYSKFAGKDAEAALELALKTPLPSLRRSIFWSVAKSDLSKAMTTALKLKSDLEVAEVVAMVYQLHERTKQVDTPTGWAKAKEKALSSKRPGIKKHVANLEKIFKGEEREGEKIPVIGKPIAEAREVQIDCVKGLSFAQKEIKANAGEGLKIVFQNKDGIDHNIVFIEKGTTQKVGNAANQLLSNPDAVKLHYVPQMPEVLASSIILKGGEKCIIYFRAPQEAGDYPYICTFPGHWGAMKGILKVEK